LEQEKSDAEADWILDAAAGFGLARETRAKPASTMTATVTMGLTAVRDVFA
jgi:hypothetical protein